MEGNGDRIDQEETLKRRNSAAQSVMQTRDDRPQNDRRPSDGDGGEDVPGNYRLSDSYGYRRPTISKDESSPQTIPNRCFAIILGLN